MNAKLRSKPTFLSSVEGFKKDLEQLFDMGGKFVHEKKENAGTDAYLTDQVLYF